MRKETSRELQVIYNGDCIKVMAAMPADSVDAIVTDPPYGLEFMGKEWDKLGAMQEWHEAWAAEALRVLKPGGHLVAFGGTRTFHRLACAIEDAGFEIRDCLSWLYGQGFPKSLDVSKAIDKAAGRKNGEAISGEARTWQGWGTTLKPAWEPIILARKPFIGTVAANVLEHRTGALNVDACRIGGGRGRGALRDVARKASAEAAGSARDVVNGRVGEASASRRYTERGGTSFALKPGPRGGDANGRWPANVAVDEAAGALLDEQSAPQMHSTGASRFFYCAKPSTRERGEGNLHPTVKPIALMRWLVRLVTPPGGVVLDPFMGSGTTGIAAQEEGFPFIGIEREAEYATIARKRLGMPR